jgi:hypothetical protein
MGKASYWSPRDSASCRAFTQEEASTQHGPSPPLFVLSSDEISHDDGCRSRRGSRRRVLLSARSGTLVVPGEMLVAE